MNYQGPAVSDNPTAEQAKTTLENTVGPFCVHCKHCVRHEVCGVAENLSYTCAVCEDNHFDLVTGQSRQQPMFCWVARLATSPCGVGGDLFEAKT